MRGFVRRVSQKVSKLSDVQVEQFLNAVTEENEMLDSIFESLSTGLIIVDEKWFVLQNNKAVERYIPFKIRLEDVKVDTTPLWELIDDEDIADFLLSCYRSDRTNVCSEFTVTTPGGSVRFITVTIIPFIRRHTSAGTVVMVADVTEKRNQEVILHRMESLAGLTNLAASVAHEIKNPLGAISIHIQLIQKALKKAREGDGRLPDQKFVEKYLAVVNEEIDNLNKIVVDFLFAVRPVSATLALINPNKLLTKFAEFFRPEFAEKHVTLDLDLCGDAPRLMIDEKLFREVITNIVQNALAALLEKFPEQDAVNVRGKLRISTAVKNDRFILTFTDNGIGMTEKTVSHIFEPYYTTKPNGTGLGMTMAYKIIKEFSGDIAVSSVRGRGSVFTITLPVPQNGMRLLTHDSDTLSPVPVSKPASSEPEEQKDAHI